MPETFQPPLLLDRATLVDPSSGTEQAGSVLVVDGGIAAIGTHLGSPPEGTQIIDCSGLVVAPGLVDMRAFIGEPGAEHRETIRSASRAAAAGGVTTLVCMPDTTPAIDDPAVVDFLMRRARDTSLVRIHPAAALTKALEGREMTEIGLLQEAGAVAFSDGTRSVADAQVFRRALTYGRRFDALVMHHLEEPSLSAEGVMNEGLFATRLGLPGVPKEAETVMLERDMRLVRLTGGRYHASVLSCADSLAILRRAKEAGLPVTAGTSINHLALNETDIGDYRTFLKLSPPLREETERRSVVAAIAEGLIDVIVSDHNPQDVETKRQPFADCADGAVGLETMLAAALRLVHAGEVRLPVLLKAMTARPAEILGLDVGRISVGAPADLIAIDLERPWVVDASKLHSRAKNTPFEGARMLGRVMLTLVAGRIVHQYADE